MHNHERVPAARCRAGHRLASAALALAAALGAASSGCGRSPAQGAERGRCRPDHGCDLGLVCASDLCVRPPPADCPEVAEQLTSIELGNYAEPETRAPVVARYKAACDAAMVSRDEAQCLDKARDRWAAGRCVPRLFPEMASSSTADCPAIAAKIRTATQNQPAYLLNTRMMRWYDRVIAAMQESCEQDRWPDALKKCVMAGDGMSVMTPSCNQQTPPSLQQRIQERVQQAVQHLD
jgi:hypothetical protein